MRIFTNIGTSFLRLRVSSSTEIGFKPRNRIISWDENNLISMLYDIVAEYSLNVSVPYTGNRLCTSHTTLIHLNKNISTYLSKMEMKWNSKETK